MSEKKYQRDKKIVSYSYDGQAYLLDEKKNEIITLNETAQILWEKLQKPTTINSLIHHFLLHYDVSEKIITNDINKIVSWLMKRGVVHSQSSNA